MNRCTTAASSRDILSKLWCCLGLFWLPAIAIAVTGNSAFGNALRTIVWTGSLTAMGGACAINAARCGRVHCYLTGPFFLLMAVVTLLHGIGIVRLGDKGWNLIGLTILVGAIALCCLPERILGKYRGARAGGERHE